MSSLDDNPGVVGLHQRMRGAVSSDRLAVFDEGHPPPGWIA